jgi:4-hydroxybenzoyl-CoA thioesterase
MPFVRELTVRFPDVDFARVVYYPRFFDYSHQVFEDFFALEVGVPYARMLQDRKVGFPSVHASADFKSPLRFGDRVQIEMFTDAIGDTSITSRYRFSVIGSARSRVWAPDSSTVARPDEQRGDPEDGSARSRVWAPDSSTVAHPDEQRGDPEESKTPCAELKIVTAVVDLDRFTGVPVPDDVRAAFERIR